MKRRIVSGRDALSRIGTALDELHEQTTTPITARRPWLECWIRAYPIYEPWCVLVEDEGGLAGAALLGRRKRIGGVHVVALGDGPSDYARLSARPGTEASLAEAVTASLRDLRSGWALRVALVERGDPVAAALRRLLPLARVIASEGAPTVRFGDDRSPRAYMSRNTRQGERARWNRMRRAGLAAEMELVTDRERWRELRPEIEAVRNLRDVDAGREARLRDARFASFWRDVLETMFARRQVEMIVLRLNGELASFVICFQDGDAYRMWDGRFHPEWGEYAPGRLVDLASLRRALLGPAFGEYDWMRGLEDYKLRTANAVRETESLFAWSSPLTAVTVGAGDAGRALLRPLKERSPALERGWEWLRRRAGGS